MARSTVYEMALTASQGQLPEALAELRGQGMGYARIATELALRFGFVVSGVTVKSWIDRAELEAVKTELEALKNTA